MSLGEVLRARDPGVDLYHVAAIVLIVDTSSVALTAVRERADEVGVRVIHHVLVLIVEQHPSDIVLAEGAVVVQEGLEVEATVPCRVPPSTKDRTRGIPTVSHLEVVVSIGELIIALVLIDIVALVAEGGRGAPVLEGGKPLKAKALGDEVQLLRVVQVGDDGALEGILVPARSISYGVPGIVRAQTIAPPAYPLTVVLRPHHGEVDGVNVHDPLVDVASTTIPVARGDGPVEVGELRVELHGDGRRGREVEVNIILEGVLHQVNVVVVGEEVLASPLQHPRLMVDVGVEEVGDLARPPTYVEVRTLVVGDVVEELLVPVYIRIEVAVLARERLADAVFAVEQRARALVRHSLVVETHIGLGVGELGQLDGHVDVVLDTHTDDGAVEVGTTLGLDDEHPVSPTRTVHGRGGSILEDGEALDDLGVEGVEVSAADLYPVEDDERSLRVHRGDPTDEEV